MDMSTSNTLKIEDLTNSGSNIKALIASAVRGVLDDPDFGLELSDETIARLALARSDKNPKTISISALKKKYLDIKSLYRS